MVHIGENTLAKRLNEFATTSAGDLTAEEFQARLGQQQGVGGGRACGWVVGWVGMCRHGLCKWGRAVAGDGGCCVENVLLGVEPATLLPKPHLLINCRTTRAVLQPKTPTPPHPGFASPSRLHPPQPLPALASTFLPSQRLPPYYLSAAEASGGGGAAGHPSPPFPPLSQLHTPQPCLPSIDCTSPLSNFPCCCRSKWRRWRRRSAWPSSRQHPPRCRTP